MNSKITSLQIIVFMLFGIILLAGVAYFRHELREFMAAPPLYIDPRCDFVRIAFAIFSVSIGYPVVAQFIRNSMDDLDKLAPKIARKSEKADPSSREKNDLEKLLNKISELQGKLKKFNTYSEFKYHIILSFILLFLATINNCINSTSATNVSITLMSNVFTFYAIMVIGYFLYFKIDGMHSYLKTLNAGIAEVHDSYNKTPSERALASLGDIDGPKDQGGTS